MKKFFSYSMLLGLFALTLLSSCNNDQSYADRLNEERNAVNAYLVNHRVVMSVPEDSVFEVGADAPFYRLDPDGNIYMQVLNAGDRVNDKAKTGEPINFRYSRYSLSVWYADGTWKEYSGNENAMNAAPCSFNYSDYTLPSSSQCHSTRSTRLPNPLHLYTANQLPHFLKRPTDLVYIRRASRATNQRQARLRWTRSRKSGEANGSSSRIIHPRR